MNYGLFSVWSSSNMVMFAQAMYSFSRYSKYHLYYYEEEIMELFYKGELCSEMTTNRFVFTSILCSYLYAVGLKIYNVVVV